MVSKSVRTLRSVPAQVVFLVISFAVAATITVAVERTVTLWSSILGAIAVGLAIGLVTVFLRSLKELGAEARARTTTAAVRPRNVRGYYLVPAELPPPPDVFVGRSAQIAMMIEVIRSPVRRIPSGSDVRPIGDQHGPPGARRILLTGRAGIGKTTTAIYFAYQVGDDYPDGQLFGRREVTNQGDGWNAVLATFVGALLGPGDQRPTEPTVLTREFARLTRERKVIVIIDDVAEHDDVSALIPSGPDCAAVLTSRDDLSGMAADLRVHLDALEPAASLKLLDEMIGEERVRGASAAATTLVDGTGNVPLGVTLTGATLAGRPHWDLQLAVKRLHDRPLATEPDALDLTYELLTDDEQRALICLGLLPQPVFAPWALAAFLDTDEAAAWKIAERLAQASLVERTSSDASGVSRFHVLDRVYEYARTRATGLPDAERNRLLRKVETARRARHRERAETDLQLHVYHLKDLGNLNEALDVARAALALAQDNADRPARELALATLAEINAELGNAADVTGLVPGPARGLGAQAIIRTERYVALTLRRQFRLPQALRRLTRALQLLDAANLDRPLDSNERIRTLRERAIAHALGDSPLDGLADLQRIESTLERTSALEDQHRPGISWAEGTIYDYADRHDEAERAMHRGLESAERTGQRLWQAWLLHGRGRLALDHGETRQCRQDAGRALELFAGMQHRYGTAHCRLIIGRAYAREDALVTASATFEETLETLSICDDAHLTAVTMAELAAIRMRQRRPAEARRLWERAKADMDRLGDTLEGTLIRQQLQNLADVAGGAAPTSIPPTSTAI
jgi:tetratricopeptide (TPR) repeat protein